MQKTEVEVERQVEVAEGARNLELTVRFEVEARDPEQVSRFLDEVLGPTLSDQIERVYREGVTEGMATNRKLMEVKVAQVALGGLGLANPEVQATLEDLEERLVAHAEARATKDEDQEEEDDGE